MGGGAVVLVLGAGLVMIALNNENTIATELQLGATSGARLQVASYYAGQASLIHNEKLIAAGGLLVGAGLIAAGILLNPSDDPGSGHKVTLAVTPAGIAIAGLW